MNKIKNAFIEIISMCNEKCPYCYNEEDITSMHELSIEEFRIICMEMRKQGVTSLTISGGEPFLHKNLYEFLTILETFKFEKTIISNGTCFKTEKNLNILKRFQPNLQITFDGHNHILHNKTRGQGNFENLVNGVYNSRKCGYHGMITARINIYKGNYRCLNKIIEHISGMNIQHISLALLHNTGKSSFNDFLSYEDFIKEIDFDIIKSTWGKEININMDCLNPDIGCPFNEVDNVKFPIKIDYQGNVYPCQLFHDKQFIMGNIKSDSLINIINNNKTQEFLLEVSSRKSKNDDCSSCNYSIYCNCGCPANSFMSTNDLSSINNCDLKKLLIKRKFKNLLKGKND